MVGRGGTEKLEAISVTDSSPFTLPAADLGADELEAAWEQLYRDHPQQFAALPAPLSLPTEWPVIAYLHALRRGEIRLVKFSDEERALLDRAAKGLRGLTGIRDLPPVSFGQWEPEGVFAIYEQTRPEGAAFSLCAEPQLRRAILLHPGYRQEAEPLRLAATCLHEVHHAANATISDAQSLVYRLPLIADVEELVVSFTQIMLSQWLRDETILVRASLEEIAAEPATTTTRRWLRAALKLTPGLETQKTCEALAQLALDALQLSDEQQMIRLLNERADEPMSEEQWRELLHKDSYL